MDRYVPRDTKGIQHRIWTLVNSWPFDFFIMFIIALNTIVLMTKVSFLVDAFENVKIAFII